MQSPEARAIIQTAPGEESQVDYGTGPMVRDAQTGKYRRTGLFVLTLGFSRKSVRLLCFHSSARIWAELHEQAFRRLGGTTRVVVLDFAPGNKIEVLWRAVLCGRNRQDPRGSGRRL
jgi:transposase